MVTHVFPREDSDIAGAFIWRLCEALVTRGHSISVVAPADRGEVGQPKLGTVRVRRVRYAPASQETLSYQGQMHRFARGPLDAFNFTRLVRALARAADEEVVATGANLIHAHWWIPGGLAVRWARRMGRPFVITLHGQDVALARRMPGGRRIMASVLGAARAVTAVSNYLAAEAASATGIPREQIPVIPMPLALGTVADPDAARSGAIFVGRLTREKGVSHLLDALAILRRQGRPMDLTIVGDGPERPALKALAIALGLNVTFTGHVAPDQVGRYLRDKQVFVYPALHDDLGVVVAEALTQGVPVVATRSGGVPDLLVDREAGILVPPTDHKELARSIVEVTSSDRFRVGALRAGRILAERLSPEKVAERFEEVYGRMRGVRPSGGGKEPRSSGAASRESPRP